jgi:plasmid stability protein
MGTVTIRNVPDRVHRRLKKKAAARGMTFAAYMREWLQRVDDEAALETIAEGLAGRNKTRPDRR